MDFTAIDFETATSYPTSVCSMGICQVKNNEVVKKEQFLIKPQPFEFNEYNIKIHGITPDMVFCKPTFDYYWDKVKHYIEGKLVIAHNAPFDVGCLKNTLKSFGIEYPVFEYLCTVRLSRKAYPEMDGHRLNNMAERFNIKFLHHDSLEDAYACAMVMLNIIKDFKISDIGDIKETFGFSPAKVFPGCDIENKKSNTKNGVLKSR